MKTEPDQDAVYRPVWMKDDDDHGEEVIEVEPPPKKAVASGQTVELGEEVNGIQMQVGARSTF